MDTGVTQEVIIETPPGRSLPDRPIPPKGIRALAPQVERL